MTVCTVERARIWKTPNARHGPRPCARALAAAFLALVLSGPAVAQDVELELVLLADASGSITEAEVRFQREGYANALTDPRVLDAIAGTAYGAIAVTYVEWASDTAVVADWAKIDGLDSAQRFSAELIGKPRQAFGRNASGRALLNGKGLIEANQFDGWRKVIDFSGDTMANSFGPPITVARDQVVAAGITINALPILRNTQWQTGDLPAAYEANIIGGPNAFVMPARSGPEFTDAVRRKLILEIAGTTPQTEYASLLLNGLEVGE